MKKISIYIVEDYSLFRLSYKKFLSEYEDIEVLEDFESAEECLEALEKEKVDVILMDIGLPCLSGIEATKIISRKYPNTKVIMLTSHNKENEVLSGLSSGASGYAIKDINAEDLRNLILTVSNGAIWVDPQIAQIVQKTFSNLKPVNKIDFNLTEREKEILNLMVKGLSNTEIAKKTVISPHTVKSHVCSILKKLMVTDRVQAAVKAVRYDL